MVTIALAMFVQQGRIDRAPQIGVTAPAVVARIVDSKDTFEMSLNRGKRPTVLIFGSCT